MEDDHKNQNGFLFQHLIAMYQTLALQQLGKLINPITGKPERNLQQARITIDMLQMIQEKTAGNLTYGEKALLDRVVLELQMNFVEEMEHKEEGQGKVEEPQGEGEPDAGAAAGGMKEEHDTTASEPGVEKKKAGKGRKAGSSPKKRSKKGSAGRKGRGGKSKE